MGPVVLGTAAFALLLCAELRWPLRRSVEPKATRVGRNLAVAAVSLVAVRLVEMPAILSLATLVERRGWGLTQSTALPSWLATAVAVVLLDYTLYVWHILTHRVSWLWRFHLVHHADLDMDASTALRFHAAELILSVPWRAAQVLLIGVTPWAFALWQFLLQLSTMFHHANVRLPLGVERALAWVFVTPRLHGIHHSAVRDETDSNWSSGLTLWDRLHGTFRDDIAEEAITIGVPAYATPGAVRFGRLLALPFVRQPPSWRRPDGVECVTRRTDT